MRNTEEPFTRPGTLCFSGHRTYAPGERDAARLVEAVRVAWRDGYRTFISGMAPGFDLAAAEAVVELRASVAVGATPEMEGARMARCGGEAPKAERMAHCGEDAPEVERMACCGGDVPKVARKACCGEDTPEDTRAIACGRGVPPADDGARPGAVRLVAAVPFAGQPRGYSVADLGRYRRLMVEADQVRTLAAAYSDGRYYRRDDWMVDRSARIVCWYDPSQGASGTRYTVRRAVSAGLEVVNLFRDPAGTLF